MTPSPFLELRLEFPFPATEVHSGIPLSNGTFGALLWGQGRNLRITINRADYWDHRGGLAFGPEATFENLKKWLEDGDEGRLREVFEGKTGEESGTPPRPTRLPMGRIDLQLPEDWATESGGLHLRTGEAELEFWLPHRPDANRAKLRAVLFRETPVLCVRITGLDGEAVRVSGLPAGGPGGAPAVVEHYRKFGLGAPQAFDLADFSGWVQECPGEPAMCVAWHRQATSGGLVLLVTSVFGEDPSAARHRAMETLGASRGAGSTPASLRTFAWWRKWWERAAEVRLPDPGLEQLYYLGMYRLGGLSVPGGPAATLQGPWVEEHRLPPWSSDYHFNINVQECYWPCFAGNHVEALEPLTTMLKSWEPKLRENAQVFAGVEDGLQLPHSTDDRGTAMTGFWTGFVDHGSTAWTGQLLWLYYRYTMDRDFLRDTAYPFLKGAMRVYEAMLEEEGGRFSLPVGVSPEFGGSGFHAWGRNASFQLAVIHFLCRTLCRAAEELGLDPTDRKRWAAIDAGLPIGALSGAAGAPDAELLLWDGQPLTESHRHHSHLAALYPFDVLDCDGNEEHRRLVRNSMRRLARMGMGQWTGWCLPWAAILYARAGNGEMAALTLEIFRRLFMTPGYASTHDARVPGFTVMDSRPDIMQVEAAEGAAAAILEMLLHTAGDVLRIFPAVPPAWRDLSFARIRAEGAFLVSAERGNGRTSRIELRSEAGAPLRLANPWSGGPLLIRRDGRPPQRTQGRTLDLETRPGEVLELVPA